MSASGLVYAAIVLMWAAVLIPMWLRRHDASTENRSAERFGQAMRVLSRREGSADRHEVVRPAPERARSASVPSSPSRPVGSRPVTARREPTPAARPMPSRSTRSQARAALARRRARTLAVLGGLAALGGLLAVASVVPAWAPVPFVVLVVAFVVHLRLQARRATQPRRRLPAERPAERRVDRPRRAPVADESVHPERAAATSRALVVETKGAPASATVALGTSGQPGHDASFAVADQHDVDDPSWQPNPLPLPTYVTAPKAVRPIRVIDLTTPGAWTSGRLLEDDVPVVADTLAEAAAAAEELDALLEQDVALDASATERDRTPRRAVGD